MTEVQSAATDILRNDDWRWLQLSNAVASRSNMDQILWTVFGHFWGANAILLVALFQNGGLPKPLVGILVALIGTALSVAWKIIQRRALGHLKFYEDVVKKLEEDLKIPATDTLSGWLNAELYKTHVESSTRWKAREVMNLCSASAVWIWAIGTCSFVFWGFVSYCCPCMLAK